MAQNICFLMSISVFLTAKPLMTSCHLVCVSSFWTKSSIKSPLPHVNPIIALLSEKLPHRDISKGQHPLRTKAGHESVLPESSWGWHKCLASLALLKNNNLTPWRWRGKKTSWSAGGCLSAWSKAMNTHITVGPGNCSSTHYSALPQRSGGGWDEAEPHTGHRGWNKSQMFWGDVKIHGHASLSGFYSILACSHIPTGTHTERVEVFEECQYWNGKRFFFFSFSFLSVVCNHSSRL